MKAVVLFLIGVFLEVGIIVTVALLVLSISGLLGSVIVPIRRPNAGKVLVEFRSEDRGFAVQPAVTSCGVHFGSGFHGGSIVVRVSKWLCRWFSVYSLCLVRVGFAVYRTDWGSSHSVGDVEGVDPEGQAVRKRTRQVIVVYQ